MNYLLGMFILRHLDFMLCDYEDSTTSNLYARLSEDTCCAYISEVFFASSHVTKDFHVQNFH